jgi:hypothetical protein
VTLTQNPDRHADCGARKNKQSPPAMRGTGIRHRKILIRSGCEVKENGFCAKQFVLDCPKWPVLRHSFSTLK